MILERIDIDSVARVFAGVLLFELFPDDIHLPLRLGRRDAGFQARGHLKPVAATALGLLIDRERRPEFTLLSRKCKARRHHADDREAAAVEVEHLSRNVAAASRSS